MYLANLDEQKKRIFLDIAHERVQVDGEFSYDEKVIIQAYCQEMNIVDYEYHKRSRDEIVGDIKKYLTQEDVKIILFELIGLCLADGNYDKSEKEFINNLCSELNVENVYSDKCEEYVRDYLKLQLKINELVIG